MARCSFCDSTFSCINTLKYHLRVWHPSETFMRYSCGEDQCLRVFDTWKCFRQHLLNVHSFSDEDVATPTPSSSQLEAFCGAPCDDNIETVVSNTSDPPVFGDFQTSVTKSAEILLAKLYSANFLPRNFVQTLVEDFDSFLGSGYLDILQNKVLSLLTSLPVEQCDLSEITEMFCALGKPFKGLETDYKRMGHFQSCSWYVPPETYVISKSRPKLFKTSSGAIIRNVKTTGQFVPFRKVLQSIFELPGAFSQTNDYVSSLLSASDGVMSNVIQGDLWKSKLSRYHPSDIVYPLHFYFDEVEANNALGAHSEKLGAGYIQIPVLPPYCQSKLENRLLAMLINADDRKIIEGIEQDRTSYNEEVFRPLIDELVFLEEKGIVCQTDRGQKRIYFVLLLVCGDNLGVHGILGFLEGFTANFNCILCRAPKDLTRSLTYEDVSFVRNCDNYSTDVLKSSAETGIKEECVFNRIPSYHVSENKFIDVMHDLPEGLSHYVMIPILKHFVDSNLFTIDALNSRIALFDYGPAESSNKPPCIADDFYTKQKLKMTAKEMLTFVRIFGVLMGDLVPARDEYWHLYLLHKQLVEVCFSKWLPVDFSGDLALLIHEHHSLYIELTGKFLPPKGHFIIHGPSVYKHVGPFDHFSSMRGEAKHRQLTMYIDAITSRRNLPLSAATKHQLMMCLRFATRSPIEPEMKCGPTEVFEMSEHCYYDSLKSSLPGFLREESFLGYNSSLCTRANWIDYMGTRYEPNMVLVLKSNDCHGFDFGKVVDIFVHQNSPIFVVHKMVTLGYCDHVCGYQVSRVLKTSSGNKQCILYTDLYSPFPVYDHTAATGKKFIVLKHYL